MALTQDTLAENERLLWELWHQLFHAHYRTIPEDLHRMLDAPNLSAHALLSEGHILPATLIAREAALDPETCAQRAIAERRIRGHALPDTPNTHLGQQDMGHWNMLGSVRIASHPAPGMQGLAGAFVDHIHARDSPELFGTLFGAGADLLRFRRAMDYPLVPLGSARSARTGEPSMVMLRPCSERARQRVQALRSTLARDLDLRLRWLALDGGAPRRSRDTRRPTPGRLPEHRDDRSGPAPPCSHRRTGLLPRDRKEACRMRGQHRRREAWIAMVHGPGRPRPDARWCLPTASFQRSS